DTYKYYLAMTLHDVNGDEYDGGYDSSVSESSTKENYFDANVRTQYHFSLADAHNISLLTGFQVEELRQKYSSATGYGIVNEKSPQINGTTNTAHDGTEKIREGYGSAASW